MKKEILELILGGLLHDIGKVVYRSPHKKKNHSELGVEFLKEKLHITNETILNQVSYHHAGRLRKSVC